MAARAIWKAELCIGAVRLPVRLYSAVREQGVHFRLLHSRDHAPVKQEMVETGRDEPVADESIQRGLELEEGMMVILKPEELSALEPPSSRDINVEAFVEPSHFDLRWYDRPYYLGPDGDEAGYFSLAKALENRRRIGIARWVMRKKRYQGALYPHKGYLLLSTLRHAEQLVALDQLRAPASRQPERAELALAEQLVAALEAKFDPAAYTDEYRQKVLHLVEAKAKGRVIKAPPRRKPEAKPRSLADTLKASLRAARGGAHG